MVARSKHWHPIYQEDADGNKIKTNQEWADIYFVPEWAVKSKASYRYLAIREAMKPSKTKNDDELHLPFQTIKQACRPFLRNLPGHPSPRKGQKQATSMPPAALAVLVPLDFDPPSGLKIYAPQ